MARIRSQHPGIFTDEAYMTLSFAARELLRGLWAQADDQGVFDWKPMTLKVRIFPADTVDLDALLAELAAANFIHAYQVEGRRFGAVRNFMKYQRPRKPSYVHPLPDELRGYVGMPGAEPVPHRYGTGTVLPPQREEEGKEGEKEEGEKEGRGSRRRKGRLLLLLLPPRQRMRRLWSRPSIRNGRRCGRAAAHPPRPPRRPPRQRPPPPPGCWRRRHGWACPPGRCGAKCGHTCGCA